MEPRPQPVILSLLQGSEAHGDASLDVRELIAACALFGLAENRVRVALARGVAASLLTTPRRGRYALGPAARPVADEVARWHRLAGELVDWSGGWVAVHAGAAVPRDRAAVRARDRALALLGLAPFERGLHLRPDNLRGGAAALRARLAALLPGGAEPGTLFSVHDLAPADEQRARNLWDRPALDATYRDTTARLSAWLDGARALALPLAARQAFDLGHRAIRQLVFDPLLPAPLVDADARARCIAAVTRHDSAGRAVWRRFLDQHRSRQPDHPPLEQTT